MTSHRRDRRVTVPDPRSLSGGVERVRLLCRTRYMQASQYLARDKSPVAVRATIVSQRGYFNILKFHPKRAVYQNLRHKLRRRYPTSLSFPSSACWISPSWHSACPAMQIARYPRAVDNRAFALALSFPAMFKAAQRSIQSLLKYRDTSCHIYVEPMWF